MRQPVVICDRCQAPCRAFSVIEPSAGPIRSCIWSPLDLCPDCTERFKEWLAGPRHQDHEGMGGSLAPTVVAAGLARTA
jgi:hypothetical protein